jgi:hypothetical protein
MLRMLTKMSMSSDVLDTQRLSIIGPVTSVSSGIAPDSKDTPVRPVLPCVVASEEPDAIPALVAPEAEYVSFASVAGTSHVSRPSDAIVSLESSRSIRRYVFVHCVRASGHSFS